MLEAATESRRPVAHARHSHRSRAAGPPHTWDDRTAEVDAEERRRALPKLFLFMLVGWLMFGLLDVYIVLVVAPGTSGPWMAGWRVAGALPPLAGWLLTRKQPRPGPLSTALEVATFAGMALCLSMRALRFGGLDSHLVQGISAAADGADDGRPLAVAAHAPDGARDVRHPPGRDGAGGAR